MRKILLFMAPLCLFLLAGCSSSKVASSWNNTHEAPASFKKVLVVGLFDDNNRMLRQQMEAQLVEQLKNEGYAVIGSLECYGPKSFRNLTEEQVLKEVRSSNIDGVITIGLVDKNRVKKYVPNYGHRPYGGYRYRPWGYVYRPYYVPGFQSGHYETNINYLFETNLYDVRSRMLVYSVQTQSYDPSTLIELANDYSRSLIRDIKKNKVLG